MKKSILYYMMAAMLIFATACSKDDDTTTDDNSGNGGTGTNSFTGINKVSVNMNGTTQEFVFADNPTIASDFSAYGSRENDENTVYTEIILGAIDHFEHVSTAALIINFLGDGTGTQDISYGLGEENNLYNFTGSNFVLLTDTATMPVMYFLEEATANITNYGSVGGYIEGTFESTVVSLAGIPQPNVSIDGNFKVKRFESKK